MSSAAEQRKRLPSDGDAILNALPNPVLVIGPDGMIMDANMAAESFFDSSTQFLQRQSLKKLVPFGSPLLALIDQVRTTSAPVNEYKVDLGTPRTGADRLVDLHVAPLPEARAPGGNQFVTSGPLLTFTSTVVNPRGALVAAILNHRRGPPIRRG